MKICVEPNENLVAELRAIKRDVEMCHGGIEERLNSLSHCVALIIDAIVDAESGAGELQ